MIKFLGGFGEVVASEDNLATHNFIVRREKQDGEQEIVERLRVEIKKGKPILAAGAGIDGVVAHMKSKSGGAVGSKRPILRRRFGSGLA